MSFLNTTIESITPYLPLFGTSIIILVILWGAHRILIARHPDLGNERLFPRQLAIIRLKSDYRAYRLVNFGYFRLFIKHNLRESHGWNHASRNKAIPYWRLHQRRRIFWSRCRAWIIGYRDTNRESGIGSSPKYIHDYKSHIRSPQFGRYRLDYFILRLRYSSFKGRIAVVGGLSKMWS